MSKGSDRTADPKRLSSLSRKPVLLNNCHATQNLCAPDRAVVGNTAMGHPRIMDIPTLQHQIPSFRGDRCAYQHSQDPLHETSPCSRLQTMVAVDNAFPVRRYRSITSSLPPARPNVTAWPGVGGWHHNTSVCTLRPTSPSAILHHGHPISFATSCTRLTQAMLVPSGPRQDRRRNHALTIRVQR